MVPTSKTHVPNLGTPIRTTQITSFSSTHFPISQISPTNSFLHQISPKPHNNPIYKITKNNLNGSSDDNGNDATIPTMADIINSSKAQKLDLKLQTLGPFFRITAKSLETRAEIGRADGLIRVWLGGKILHLDSIRLQRETLGMEKSIFGIGVFLGAVAIRYGYDCGCGTAELLAINDSDLYHSKVHFCSSHK